METRQNSIKKELCKWSKKTTISGIPKITESKAYSTKIIWILFIALFYIMLSQKIADLVAKHFKYEITTRINLESNREAKFPAISFKIINWLNFRNYKQLLGTVMNFEDYIQTDSDQESLKDKFLISQSNFMASYLVLESTYKDNHSLETETALNSMYSCYFNNKKCGLEDFRLVKPQGDAAFLQFNVDTPEKYTNKFGKNSGLQLELFIGFRENQSPTSQETGVLLFVHEPKK